MSASYFLRIFKKNVIAIPIEAPRDNHCSQLIFVEFGSIGALMATTSSSTIESYKVSDGNEFVVIRSDLHAADELVVSTWSTLVVRA